MPSMPITTPMLKMFEPKTSPTLMPGVPSRTEKRATIISGVAVKTARTTIPADVSLTPVISISRSSELMVKWLANAKKASEEENISS